MSSVKIIGADGNEIRQYSEEIHGENYLEIAESFAKDNNATVEEVSETEGSPEVEDEETPSTADGETDAETADVGSELDSDEVPEAPETIDEDATSPEDDESTVGDQSESTE